jgi:hypothetical protein
MSVKYIYNGKEYRSEKVLRQAIFEKTRKAFGKVVDWSKFGVEVVEVVPSAPSLDVLKSQKMVELEERFADYRQSKDTFIESSLGFRANANIVAFDNVSGLVAQLQYRQENGEANPTIGFMTFDDELVTLSLADLKKLQVEISENGSKAYAQKWAIRTAIENAKNEEELNAIDIVF